jgi:hypothetical protein
MSVDTDFGSMYGAYRPAGPGENYWRMANFLFPFYAHIPGDHGVSHRMWVPMHDHHTMFYVLHKPDTDAQRIIGKRLIQWNVPLEPQNTTDWYGRFRLEQDASNDYLIDRDAQRAGVKYTGITGVFSEDHAVTESMGPVLDRTNEHVGTSDVMVIRIRRRLLEAARALAEHKITPPGVDDPDVYRTRGGEHRATRGRGLARRLRGTSPRRIQRPPRPPRWTHRERRPVCHLALASAELQRSVSSDLRAGRLEDLATRGRDPGFRHVAQQEQRNRSGGAAMNENAEP